MTEDWIDLKELKPEKGVAIIVKDYDGSEYIVSLCNVCGNCWRDSFSGGMLMINPTHWRNMKEDRNEKGVV